MLEIHVGAIEWFDESTDEFKTEGGLYVELEHSLLAVSKWEQKYEKPFLGKQAKDPEEILEYVWCMVTSEIPRGVFLEKLSERNLEDVRRYMDRKMTATTFRDGPSPPRTSEVVTSELIYYWMASANIPFACERWHLNRLFTLIRVANLKSAKPKKMGRQEALARQRELNAQRKAQLGTNG